MSKVTTRLKHLSVKSKEFEPITKVFLRINTENSRKIKFANGHEIYFDNTWEQNKHAQQIGEIAYIPKKYTTKDNDVPLKKGDIVYFHHLASQVDGDGNDVFGMMVEGELLYMQPIDQIFAVKRGEEITMLGTNVFIEQLTEDEGNCKTVSGIILKDKPDEIDGEGTIVALPVNVSLTGFLGRNIQFNKELKVGSHVSFNKKKKYEINADFGKRKVYKMDLTDIFTVFD